MKKTSTYLFYFLLGLVLILSSCRPTKRISEGDVFLKKNSIVVNTKSKFDLSKDELYSILKQKPNRKILFFFRFNLAMYNAINPRIKEKKHIKKVAKKNRKIENINQKIDLTTKKTKLKKLNRKLKKAIDKEPLTWRDKWTDIIGESPVVIDSSLIEKSQKQMEIYLVKKGYFNNEVDYEVIYPKIRRKKNKAKVIYSIKPKEHYIINCIDYEIEDPVLKSVWAAIRQVSKSRPGQRFDISQLDDDRERITHYLNNRGYYFFTKDYIAFDVDSSLNNHTVDIYLKINPFSRIVENDTTVLVSHKKYFIGDISIHTQYRALDNNYDPEKRKKYGDFTIYYDSSLTIKPKLLSHLIEIKKGEVYQKDKIEITYKRLVSLGVFDGVNIQFTPTTIKNRNMLNCEIRLTPAKKQAFAIETTGTHRDGSLGLLINTSYRHKNIFKSAESGQFGINFGAEAQRTIIQTQNSADVIEKFRFNTFEIGPEISFNLHNLFPIPLTWTKRSNEPTTKITAAFNFQKRPDYDRTLTQFKYSGNFIENKRKGSSIHYDLFNISLIRINKSDAFITLLNELNNPFLSASYNNHFISSAKVSWVVNSQKNKYQLKYHYFKIGTEFSGFLFRGIHNLSNSPKNETGSYELFNIAYSNYIKPEIDYRRYRQPNLSNTLAARVYGSIGFPFENLKTLPFEKSYFSGGSNGIRAWQVRTLGPGSFRDTLNYVSYTNIGEIKLETNMEYRFKLTDLFEGALFIDVGNIWLLNEDPQRPGAEFKPSKLWNDLAIGSGIGLRMDFDYFLIRFDLGFQIKDPLKIDSEQWAWQPKTEYLDHLNQYFPEYLPKNNFPIFNFNLGIGYPF